MPAAARRKQRAQRLKLLGQFVREHSWGVMITVLIVIALVLFVCVIAGASPKQADEPQTAQDAAPRYESGFICAITTQVPYYDEDLSQTGTVARGMQITYSTDKSVERDGVRYYLTYFTTLDCGYVSEENLTQDPDAVIAEKVVYVRTPQNLRLAKDSIELGPLLEKGTQLQVLGYEGTTNGVVDLYEVSYQGETGYISGQYVATTEEEANEVYDRFGVYAIHAGRGDRLGGGDAESLDYFPREKADFADNKMPNPCYAIYLTCDPAVLADIDKYIEYAKTTKINAFVVNIMDGTQLQVLGYEGTTNGVVDLYEVSYQGETGYISGQYVATTEEEANEVYDRFGVYAIHAGRGDRLGGGDAESLDYFPREKADFADNKMPNPCYAIYLTCDPAVLADIDKYIEYAKTTKINAFVVNIMDGTSIGYNSPVYEEYSPTAYQYANNTVEEYRQVIQKIKDAGFYAIGRLTVFNDSFFCQDHPEYAIADQYGEPLMVANASYWPSAFCRYVWEYKVALAIDAVETMGFNEIQFDYVRFPDRTDKYEEAGTIDFRNEYGETKAQAIQRFLMYATDILHEYGVYVGADVFGEASSNYVTAYGQYWPAVSNVVDVISGMPYPDHFARNGTYRPWEHPYETLLDWTESAAKRQSETPSPAIDRTWIQAYNAIQPPYNEYGVQEIGDEIRGLREQGFTGGFMAWNASCSLTKLEELRPLYEALED